MVGYVWTWLKSLDESWVQIVGQSWKSPCCKLTNLNRGILKGTNRLRNLSRRNWIHGSSLDPHWLMDVHLLKASLCAQLIAMDWRALQSVKSFRAEHCTVEKGRKFAEVEKLSMNGAALWNLGEEQPHPNGYSHLLEDILCLWPDLSWQKHCGLWRTWDFRFDEWVISFAFVAEQLQGVSACAFHRPDPSIMANRNLQNTPRIIRQFYISLQNFRLISGPMLLLFPRMEKIWKW